MATREILFIISLSISLPVMACIAMYKKINLSRTPIHFLFSCLLLGLLVETGSYFKGETRLFAICFNFYLLLEFLLLQMQFHLWLKPSGGRFPLKLILPVMIFWFVSMFMTGGPTIKNTPFILVYSSVMIVTAISLLNRIIFSTGIPAKNSIFLVCVSLIVTYTFAIIVEFFCMYHKLFSEEFIVNVFYVKSILNALSNFTLATAFLCLPKKQQYSLSF